VKQGVLLLVVLLQLLSICRASYAGCEADKIRSLFDKNENVKAVALATVGAEDNDPECQLLLAVAYMFEDTAAEPAETVHQDLAKSQHWLQQAAKNGSPLAQHTLGSGYLGGVFGKTDSELGFDWIKKAAENGNSEAYEKLAKLYLKQFYGGQYIMASQLFRAEQWASLLAKSKQEHSVHAEICQASQHYFKKLNATFSGLISPIENRCTLYKSEHTAKERDAWFADASINEAMLHDIIPGEIQVPDAGPCQFNQLEKAWNRKDYKTSIHYARIGRSDNDDPRCQFYFGMHLSKGLGTHEAKKNITQGAQWIKKAAENGLDAAEKRLYQFYVNGTLENNDSLAAFWLAQSANNGDAISQFEFGDRLIHGRGVQQDTDGGIHWLEQSAENGFSVANLSMAVHYARGDLVTKDLQQAALNAYLASNAGQKDAKELHDAICREFSTNPPPNFDPNTLDFALTNCPKPRDHRGTRVSSATKQPTDSKVTLYDFLSTAAVLVAVDAAFDELSNKGASSRSNTTKESSECADTAPARVTYCTIRFDTAFGTGEIYNIDVDCRGGSKAKPCERRLESAVQYRLIDSYHAFCELENTENWHREKHRVIQNICSN
tara:strand:+ start:108 stop:1925 length:1818 start_codon:yes stop_codon:yes gene_type:complete